MTTNVRCVPKKDFPLHALIANSACAHLSNKTIAQPLLRPSGVVNRVAVLTVPKLLKTLRSSSFVVSSGICPTNTFGSPQTRLLMRVDILLYPDGKRPRLTRLCDLRMKLCLRRVFGTASVAHDLRAFLDVPVLKGQTPSSGNGWSAAQLRLKSWDDLHKLWYVLLKERLMLRSEMLRFSAMGEKTIPSPERYRHVKKSMCRIKFVLTERALKEKDSAVREELKRRINAL